MNDFICKPVSPRVFYTTLSSWLALRKGAPSQGGLAGATIEAAQSPKRGTP
jgi:hypothetical protein